MQNISFMSYRFHSTIGTSSVATEQAILTVQNSMEIFLSMTLKLIAHRNMQHSLKTLQSGDSWTKRTDDLNAHIDECVYETNPLDSEGMLMMSS